MRKGQRLSSPFNHDHYTANISKKPEACSSVRRGLKPNKRERSGSTKSRNTSSPGRILSRSSRYLPVSERLARQRPPRAAQREPEVTAKASAENPYLEHGAGPEDGSARRAGAASHPLSPAPGLPLSVP